MKSENLLECSSVSQFLIEYFERCKLRNASFSLRAFAKKLDMAPSSVSMVLSGRQNVSPIKVKQIARKLNLDDFKKDYLICLASKEVARTDFERSIAEKRLAEINRARAESLRNDIFKLIEDWEYLAVLNLIHLEGFEAHAETISNALHISEMRADEVVDRLLKLDLVFFDHNGKLEATHQYCESSGKEFSLARKKYHQQMLKKASEAIIEENREEREFQSAVFTLNSEGFSEIKKILNRAMSDVMTVAAENKGHDRVYALNAQFFKLASVHVDERINNEKMTSG